MPQYKPHIVHCNGWNHKVHLTRVMCHNFVWEKNHILYVVMVLELTMFSMLEVTTTSYLKFKLDLQSITPLNNAWTSSFFYSTFNFPLSSNMFFKLQVTSFLYPVGNWTKPIMNPTSWAYLTPKAKMTTSIFKTVILYPVTEQSQWWIILLKHVAHQRQNGDIQFSRQLQPSVFFKKFLYVA